MSLFAYSVHAVAAGKKPGNVKKYVKALDRYF
jgi:hypothetical protein